MLQQKLGGIAGFAHLLTTNLQTTYKELAPLTNVLTLPPDLACRSHYTLCSDIRVIEFLPKLTTCQFYIA